MNNLLYKHGQVAKNKFWELQIMWHKDWTWFKVYIDLSRNCDHQGFTFNFEVFKLDFDFKIYDNRHWDYDNNCYEK